MASSRMGRSDTCTYENCGSRRFHIGGDGYTYCDQGHQQSERGTVVTEDTGEYVVYGSTSKKRDSDAESATSKALSYSGARAFEHYLLCAQLVLRKQLRWLIEVQQLPEELETIVKDLWALRLHKLQGRTTYNSDTETEAQSAQLFSSQSESESKTESRSSRRSQRRDGKTSDVSPSLVETLALCYIGLLLLRIPVVVSDMSKWVNDGELLYYRAHREVPTGMRERLPGEYERQLEPPGLLQPQALHQSIGETLTRFGAGFGMAVPSINTPLVLFRWIKSLMLPLGIFVATQRLARALSIDFGFDTPQTHVVLRYPEVRLMVVVVIATKLLLPFDEVVRYPELAKDLTTLSMDWKEWMRLHKLGNEENSSTSQINFARAFSFTEADCLEAADETLDAYLEWCIDNVASEEIRERGPAGRDASFRRALFGMFPLDLPPQRPRNRPQATATRHPDLLQAQKMLSIARPRAQTVAVEDAHRPGSLYRRFKHVEGLSDTARTFFEESSRLAGVSLDDLVQAVFYTERQMQKREDAFRQATES